MGIVEKKSPSVKITESSECLLKKEHDGVRCCAVHGKPLQKLTTSNPDPGGLRQISTWRCLDSGKTIMELEGF